jgi:hypothetical protein
MENTLSWTCNLLLLLLLLLFRKSNHPEGKSTPSSELGSQAFLQCPSHLDYNKDRGSGTIISKKRFLESIFEVADVWQGKLSSKSTGLPLNRRTCSSRLYEHSLSRRVMLAPILVRVLILNDPAVWCVGVEAAEYVAFLSDMIQVGYIEWCLPRPKVNW